jgi:Rhs element Vgr protein
MAQAVETIIEIDGIRIEQFFSLKLSQGIYAHHFFRLECPAETVNENEYTLFNGSRNLIGAPMHLKVTSASDRSSLLFTGVVTQVEAVRHNGHPGCIVISGYSPTITLDNGADCRSWERKSIKSIVNNVLKSFPGDWLKKAIAPRFTDTIYYTIQYKETAWQFINRLAGMHGEWLYYDGQRLVLGTPKGKKMNLVYGEGLSRFELCMQLKQGNLEMWAYDYVNNEVYTSQVESAKTYAGDNELEKYALMKSQAFFDPQRKYWHNHFIRSKKQLDELTEAQAAMQCSNMLRLNGYSDLPGFQPGDLITIKMIDDRAKEALGDFRVLSIEHRWDGTGNYANEFVAIPATAKAPPVTPVPEPYYESQSAVVVENHDTAGMGRVRVRFHWMNEKEKSPWLRIIMPHTGKDAGLFMLPEIGAEVMVAGGNAKIPYIIGEVYNGKTTTNFGSAGNDIKAIQTRSGIKIIMNDKDGSILIEDKDGNGVQFNGEGIAAMRSKDTMVLECGEAKIILNKDGTIQINGNKIKVDANEEVKINSNAHANINASAKVAVQSAMITLN